MNISYVYRETLAQIRADIKRKTEKKTQIHTVTRSHTLKLYRHLYIHT